MVMATVLSSGTGAIVHDALTVDLSEVVGMRPEQASAAAAVQPLLQRIQREEGFRSRPYRDSEGVLTIGYGTNLDVGITSSEALFLEQSRLVAAWECWDSWPGTSGVSDDLRRGLTDMSYQLGCEGAMEFKGFLAALAAGNDRKAEAELADSRWAREAPARVRILQRIVREALQEDSR